MKYFRILTDDERFPKRWFLDEPRTANGSEIDAREFTYGRPYLGPRPARVPIDQAGPRVQFHLAAFDMPVVTQEIAQLVEKIGPGEIECFPVTVDASIFGYVILNVVHREGCVDESRSEIIRWKPDDGRPEEVGKYKMIYNLTIDPTLTHSRHIFRVDDWEIALIVSERIKESLEEVPDLGIIFKPVC